MELKDIIEEDRKSLREMYFRHTDSNKKAANEHSFFLDKVLFTISTGAIFLFFSFSDKLNKIFLPSALLWIKIVITLMILATISLISGFIFALFHFSRSSKIFNDWYIGNLSVYDALDKIGKNNIEESSRLATKLEAMPNTVTKSVKLANLCNYFAYGLTILCLIISIYNVWSIATPVKQNITLDSRLRGNDGEGIENDVLCSHCEKVID